MKLYHTENDKKPNKDYLERNFFEFLNNFNQRIGNALALSGVSFSFEDFSLTNKEGIIKDIYNHSYFPLKYRQTIPTVDKKSCKTKKEWLKKEFLINYLFSIYEESEHFILNHKEYDFENSLEYRLCDELSKENLINLNQEQIISLILNNPIKAFNVKNIKGSVFNQLKKLKEYNFSLNENELFNHIMYCINQVKSEKENFSLKDMLFTDLNLKEFLSKKTLTIEDTFEFKLIQNKEKAFALINKNHFYKNNKIKIISQLEEEQIDNLKKESDPEFDYYFEIYKKYFFENEKNEKHIESAYKDLIIIKNKISSLKRKVENKKQINIKDTIEYWLVNKLIDLNKSKVKYDKNKTLSLERDYYVEFLIHNSPYIRNNVKQLDFYHKANLLSHLLKIDKKTVEKIANDNLSLKDSVLLKNKNINKKTFNSKQFLSIMFLIKSLELSEIETFIFKEKSEEFLDIAMGKQVAVSKKSNKKNAENNSQGDLENNNALRGNKIEEIIVDLINNEENSPTLKNLQKSLNELNKYTKSQSVAVFQQETQNIQTIQIKEGLVLNQTKKELGGVKTDIVLKTDSQTEKHIGVSVKSFKTKNSDVNLGDFIPQNLFEILERKGKLNKYSKSEQDKIKFFFNFYHNPMLFSSKFNNENNELMKLNHYLSCEKIDELINWENEKLPRVDLEKFYYEEKELGKLGFNFIKENLAEIAMLNLSNDEKFLKFFAKVDLTSNDNEITVYAIKDIKNLLHNSRIEVRNNQFCLSYQGQSIFQLKTYVPSAKVKDKNSYQYYKRKGKSRGVLENRIFNILTPLFKLEEKNLLERKTRKIKYIDYVSIAKKEVENNFSQKEKTKIKI